MPARHAHIQAIAGLRGKVQRLFSKHLGIF
jgi:hypothetical protein